MIGVDWETIEWYLFILMMGRGWFAIVCTGILAAGFPMEREVSLGTLTKGWKEKGWVLEAPQLEATPEQIRTNLSQTLAEANRLLGEIASVDPTAATFENTIWALDDALYLAGLFANRMALLKDVHPDKAIREAATDALKQVQDWFISVEYREDLYSVIKAFSAKKPKLDAEQQKYLDELLRDFRRAGFELPAEKRREVEEQRKELARLGTDFENNILAARCALTFTGAELDGVPKSFLMEIRDSHDPDRYIVLPNVTYHYITVMETARREDVRRRVCVARFSLAMEQNLPLLQRILHLRRQIATALGYANWADYVTETRMAGSAQRAREFCEELIKRLEPRFKRELAIMRELKREEVGDPSAELYLWDWRYYARKIRQRLYNLDPEAVREYLALDSVLQGMFDLFGELFGLRFVPIKDAKVWHPDVRVVGIVDIREDMPLGLLYLDLYPRDGKYNHFAQFGIVEGKQWRNGVQQRPVSALVCNFPPPSGTRPSLLRHEELETLFHEFGHALHALLTRVRFARFSGTSVPRDFVEVPSQTVQEWAWQPEVLRRFARHFVDQSRVLPAEWLDGLRRSRNATVGCFYRRQMAFALTDLLLHVDPRAVDDPAGFANQIFSKVFLPVPDQSAFVAFFGHLVGYDASYYGYAWADVLVANVVEQFEAAPNGLMDKSTAERFRTEILEVGDSRPVEESLKRFLGKQWGLDAFLKRYSLLEE